MTQCRATFTLLEEANDGEAPLLLSHDHFDIRAGALTSFGMIHLDSYHPFEALRSFEEALPLAESIGDSGKAAEVLGLVSFAYRKQGLFDKALEAAQRAVSIDGGTTRSCVHLGDVLRTLGRYEEALTYYGKAFASASNLARRSR